MKFGTISKSADNSSSLYSAANMEKINRFSLRKLSEDEVYIFRAVMCDNEIDRDNERFSVETLRELAEKFIGKTFICDHDRKNANQTARIFDTEVVRVPSVRTFDGEELHQLVCTAYMLKSESTEAVINNIEAGIYKEVSVSCAVSSQVCSICGEEYYGGTCPHWRGNIYGGKKCFLTLKNATDAYELSFVAVPAQPGAGVIKWYKGDDNAKKKGMINNMSYEELKKSLAAMGVDIDSIAKTKGEIPPMKDILGAVKKSLDSQVTAVLESAPVFITADAVKAAAGKEMSADEVISLIKESGGLSAKAKLYDELKGKAVDAAVKSGIRAKGEAFGEERYRKIFEGFSVEEINAQAAEWEAEARKALNPGRTSEYTDKSCESLAIGNLDDYRI